MNSRTLNRLKSSLQRYALAFLLTAVFLFLRGALDPVIGTYIPYLAVLPAVVLAAWFCGLGPSLLAMIIAFLGEQYWFIPPTHTLRIVGKADFTGAVVYFFVSLTIILFADTIRRTSAALAITTQKLQEAGAELSRSHSELERVLPSAPASSSK